MHLPWNEPKLNQSQQTREFSFAIANKLQPRHPSKAYTSLKQCRPPELCPMCSGFIYHDFEAFFKLRQYLVNKVTIVIKKQFKDKFISKLNVSS